MRQGPKAVTEQPEAEAAVSEAEAEASSQRRQPVFQQSPGSGE